ncbi:MAG: hypothetical protein UT94_C0024G0013 [Candidatus Uhrbacteria bacterium GW2011_GWF2_40_263]|nr:MAG: hypothetical protein UT94_C0024G0013 [Candidatus Uhrbacteria bacterium GW2011_GWF2_40_263]
MKKLIEKEMKFAELQPKATEYDLMYWRGYMKALSKTLVFLDDYKMQVAFDDSEVEELSEGEDFEWEFDGIKIHIYPSDKIEDDFSI